MSEIPSLFEQPYTPLETLRESAQTRLHTILHAPLTVENIETFADEALNQTIDLVKDLIYEYQTNPNLEGDLSLDPQLQEDAVCEKLSLPNIQDILQRIIEVRNNIESIKQYLEESKEGSGTIITPPDGLEQPIGEAGDKAFERKNLVPRLLTLMYILQKDFDLDIKNTEQVQVLGGEVNSNMMRKTPYVRVTVSSLKRSVYICDEEGNASYVFDMERLSELHIPLDDLDRDGKQDKNSLIAMHPGVGMRVIQTPNWRNRIKTYLEEGLPVEAVKAETDDFTIRDDGSKSEFQRRERSSGLPYEEWCEEVKAAWDAIPEEEKPNNVTNWYTKEKNTKNKDAWPSESKVKKKYESSGFISLNNLVGKENIQNKEYLEYAEWIKEVQAAWRSVSEESPALEDWYAKERMKGHKRTWPYQWYLKKQYGEAGFISLNDILGKENHLEKEFRSFDVWCEEVKGAWDAISEEEKPSEITNWYNNEKRENHDKTWPNSSSLRDIYGSSGFVGLKKMLAITYVSFDAWAEEVHAKWVEANEVLEIKDVKSWYDAEYKKHLGRWPGHSSLSRVFSEKFQGLSKFLKG